MKVTKGSKSTLEQFSDETKRKGTRLTPNKKSGKERHHLYQSLEQEDEDIDYFDNQPKESILDYLDDEEE